MIIIKVITYAMRFFLVSLIEFTAKNIAVALGLCPSKHPHTLREGVWDEGTVLIPGLQTLPFGDVPFMSVC